MKTIKEKDKLYIITEKLEIREVVLVGPWPDNCRVQCFADIFAAKPRAYVLSGWDVFTKSEAIRIQKARLAEMYTEIHGTPEPWDRVVEANFKVLANALNKMEGKSDEKH